MTKEGIFKYHTCNSYIKISDGKKMLQNKTLLATR